MITIPNRESSQFGRISTRSDQKEDNQMGWWNRRKKTIVGWAYVFTNPPTTIIELARRRINREVNKLFWERLGPILIEIKNRVAYKSVSEEARSRLTLQGIKDTHQAILGPYMVENGIAEAMVKTIKRWTRDNGIDMKVVWLGADLDKDPAGNCKKFQLEIAWQF